MYDIVSGSTVLRKSYYINKERTGDAFPQLNTGKHWNALFSDKMDSFLPGWTENSD